MSKYAENHEEMLLDKLRRYIDAQEYKYESPYITKGDVEVIIHALEKQIPKKPKCIDKETETFDCPCCGHTIIALDDMTIHNNCLMCGQKLDWSDTD